jgi:hypothetical protein
MGLNPAHLAIYTRLVAGKSKDGILSELRYYWWREQRFNWRDIELRSEDSVADPVKKKLL